MEAMSAYDFCVTRVKSVRAEQRRLRRASRFPEGRLLKNVTGCLYSLRHIGGNDAIVLYLRMKWKGAKTAFMTEGRLLDIAKRIHDDSTAAEKTAWRYPRNEQEEKVMNIAHRHLAVHRLVRWIMKMNIERGVAPKSEDLAQAYAGEYNWRGMPWVQNDGAMVKAMQLQTKRKWAERLRQNWNLKIGTLKVETPMAPGEIARKAHDLERVPHTSKTYPPYWLTRRRP